jgi:hypothetical protein
VIGFNTVIAIDSLELNIASTFCECISVVMVLIGVKESTDVEKLFITTAIGVLIVKAIVFEPTLKNPLAEDNKGAEVFVVTISVPVPKFVVGPAEVNVPGYCVLAATFPLPVTVNAFVL